VSGPSSEALAGAVRAIESWLLESGVQLAEGPHRGGVAGWLDGTGRPAFVYLEITGYYLTTMAWLAGGMASSPARAEAARARGRAALEWMRGATADGALPPTRLHLLPGGDDWRNHAAFTFDLAMAARGASSFGAVGDAEASAPVLTALTARLREICGGHAPLASHALYGGHPELPARWSTRPGPHHAKAAAALLRLPEGALDRSLRAACRDTVAIWAEAVARGPTTSELHPLLYACEGLAMDRAPPATAFLDILEGAFQTIMRLQDADGSLPGEAPPAPHHVRSDVLAQALRIGTLLAVWRPPGDEPALRRLAVALLRHVRPDGGVLFALDQDVLNAWCAMFAHQALALYAGLERGDRLPAGLPDLLI
jgi:hypothetical protein